MTGYVRQSAADIAPGNEVTAAPLNNEFNQLQAAFNGATGHTHTGATGDGPRIPLTTSVSGILPVENGGTGASTIQGIADTVFDGTTLVHADKLIIVNEGDDTKRFRFSASGITPGETRVVHIPDSDITIQAHSIHLDNLISLDKTNGNFVVTDGTTYTHFNGLDLYAIESLSGTGLAARTASNTWNLRTIQGTTNRVTVTNGNGVAGNPTISLPDNVTITGSMSAASFSGSGTGLTALNASNLSSGTVPNVRLPVLDQSTWNAGSSSTEAAISPSKLVNAILAAVAAAALPPGVIMDYSGTTAPSGWLLCAGQAVSRTEYANLFAIIGTTYGAGNGSTTFNLPDLRGRVTAGLDNMGGTNANRLSSVFTSNVLGEVGGASTISLTVPHLPSHSHTGTTASAGSHNHTGTTSSDGGHSHSAGSLATGSAGGHTHRFGLPGGGGAVTRFENGVFGLGGRDFLDYGGQAIETAGAHTHSMSGNTGSVGNHNHSFTTSTTGSHTHTFTTDNTGSGSAHGNVQPTMVMNKIIKT